MLAYVDSNLDSDGYNTFIVEDETTKDNLHSYEGILQIDRLFSLMSAEFLRETRIAYHTYVEREGRRRPLHV
jgi:hypothetical protein